MHSVTAMSRHNIGVRLEITVELNNDDDDNDDGDNDGEHSSDEWKK